MCNGSYIFIGFILGVLVSASVVSVFIGVQLWRVLHEIKDTLDRLE